MGISVMNKLLAGGHEVVVWNKTKEVLNELKVSKSEYFLKEKLKIAFSVEGLHEKLLKPRTFWLTLSSKEETGEILSEITNIAELGDLIIDGGDSNFKDTQARFDALTPKGFKYLGIGISGVGGVESGFCVMAGGNKDGYEYLRPILDSLALPNGVHNYFGAGGSGHFVKMVLGGVEQATAQALSEGFGILEKSPYGLNLLDAGYVWQRGSDIRSVLLDAVVNVFKEDPGFVNTEGVVSAPTDVKLLIEQAKQEGAPVDAIGKTLDFAERSQYDKAAQTTFAAKLMAAMEKRLGTD